MTDQPKRSRFAPDSIAAPLRHAVFRRIWLASLVSNLGILIQGVGAAWAMTQMTSSADKVALVSFESVDTLGAAASTAEGQTAGRALLEDERRFLDLERCVISFAEPHEVMT